MKKNLINKNLIRKSIATLSFLTVAALACTACGKKEEETDFLPAKTRLGEASIRIAVIPQEEFQKLPETGRVGREQAKEILSWSVSVSADKLKLEKKTCCGGIRPWMGDGLLRGLFVLPGCKGRCEFDDGGWVELNDEYGLIMNNKMNL